MTNLTKLFLALTLFSTASHSFAHDLSQFEGEWEIVNLSKDCNNAEKLTIVSRGSELAVDKHSDIYDYTTFSNIGEGRIETNWSCPLKTDTSANSVQSSILSRRL